jgi:SH3-like domain-containing protein
MKSRTIIGLSLPILFAATSAVAQLAVVPGARPTPYWASIKAGEAKMRSGPGRNYPSTWFYRRAGLPVQVIEVYPGWRKVKDPDGTAGWMIQNLISGERTAIIVGGLAELHDTPDAASRVAWRAEAGVVGRISKCGGGWCRLSVGNRGGFVQTMHLWGVDQNEMVD